MEKKKRRVRADVLLIAALLILSGAFFLVRYLRSAGGDVAAEVATYVTNSNAGI